MRHIKFPSIGEYRNALSTLRHNFYYVGKDENGDPIYDKTKIIPKIEFTGTVKLHGSNGGVCYNIKTGELWAGSKKRVLDIGNDNHGFAAFVEKNKESFIDMAKLLHGYEKIRDDVIVCIYGEWAGTGIQKEVAISQLENMFVIFGVRYVDINDTVEFSQWSDNFNKIKDPENRIFNIMDFESYHIMIDPNYPEEAQNSLIEITKKVEKECPVGNFFGVKGTGEGVVWTTTVLGEPLRFKVKGAKHSPSKIKKLAKVDPEKIASVKEYVEYTCTENRLQQGFDEVFEGTEPDIKRMGEFIAWVARDIIKEETDTLIANNLIWKDVASKVAKKAREWLLKNHL